MQFQPLGPCVETEKLWRLEEACCNHFFHQCLQQRLAIGQEGVESVELKARFLDGYRFSSGVQFKIEALPFVPVGCSVDV